MCIIERPTVVINGMKFTVVPKNETHAKPTMTYAEALAYSKGQSVASSS
jgi:hypothetical protein